MTDLELFGPRGTDGDWTALPAGRDEGIDLTHCIGHGTALLTVRGKDHDLTAAQLETARAFDVSPGDSCPLPGCDGAMDLAEPDNCSCHLSPPCGACTDAGLVCRECGWLTRDGVPDGAIQSAPK